MMMAGWLTAHELTCSSYSTSERYKLLYVWSCFSQDETLFSSEKIWRVSPREIHVRLSTCEHQWRNENKLHPTFKLVSIDLSLKVITNKKTWMDWKYEMRNHRKYVTVKNCMTLHWSIPITKCILTAHLNHLLIYIHTFSLLHLIGTLCNILLKCTFDIQPGV